MKRVAVFLVLVCLVKSAVIAQNEEHNEEHFQRGKFLSGDYYLSEEDLEETYLDRKERDADEMFEENLDLEERDEEDMFEEDLELEERDEDMWSEDEELALVERKYKAMAWPEGGTDQTVHENSNVVLNARAMSKLLQHQDVVSTCRYILFKTWQTFYEAKESCETVEWPFTHSGIGMASITSQEDNDDIRILLQEAFGQKYSSDGGIYYRDNWVWVGLHKKVDNERKLSNKEKGDFEPLHWNWTDGSNPTYSNWMSKMPDQQWDSSLKTFQNWVQVNKKGYWDDTHNGKSAPYACNYCGKYIVVAAHETWTRAQELCTSYGLTMAIVDSADDNLELAWAANTTFGPKTGEHRWNATNWIWLGTQEIMDDINGNGTGVWHHHDGTPLNWEPVWDWKRQPDNWVTKQGEQQVVAFSRITQKWDDSFKWKKRPFACMCDHRACEYDRAN